MGAKYGTLTVGHGVLEEGNNFHAKDELVRIDTMKAVTKQVIVRLDRLEEI